MTRCRPNPKGGQPAPPAQDDVAPPDAEATVLPPPRSESARALLKRIADEKAKIKSRLNRLR